MHALSQRATGDMRINCRGVTFMASASVGDMLRLFTEHHAAGRRVKLVEVPRHLSELFKRMRLNSLFGGDEGGLD